MEIEQEYSLLLTRENFKLSPYTEIQLEIQLIKVENS